MSASISWPVSTIGSVSDYDYIGNQEVAGSSPVLVIFLQSSSHYGQIVHYAISINFVDRHMNFGLI